MFLSYDDMKKFKVVYRNGEGPEHALSDIHMNPETGELISYVYAVERMYTERGDVDYTDQTLDMVTAAGGAGGNISNIPQGEDLPITHHDHLDYFFINAGKVSVEGDTIYYTGAEKVEESERADSLSIDALLKKEIVTEEGKEVGKIKDIFVEIDKNRVEGIKISEGFWQKLMGDGTKFLPLEAVVKWAPEPVIVKDPVEDYLMDEVEDIE